MHFREIPFLRLYVPLCVGIILAEHLRGLASASLIVMTIALAVMTLCLIRKSYSPDSIFGSALLLFLASAGYLLHYAEKHQLSDLEEGRKEMLVRISEYPEKKYNSYTFRATMMTVFTGKSICHPRGSILLYFINDSTTFQWQPGDMLLIRVSPRPVTNNGNPCEFNYRRYMEGQGIKYIGFFRQSDLKDYRHATHLSVMERSQVAAHGMIAAFKKAGLYGDGLALVTALTIGDKDLLDREQLASFARSGAMHIMAVSGLHVGMISLGLSFLLFFLRGRLKIIKSLIIIVALWGFAFLTGMTPSVLRATIMFTFLQTGTIMNRPSAGMNNLLSSAFIITAFRPAVLFEAGFQLSYIAVAFIILFYDPFYRIIRLKSRIPDYLWQLTAISLVAQAGTLALTVRMFNMFPLCFLLTNLIVIPVSFVVLLMAFILIIASPVAPVSGLIAAGLGKLSELTLSFTAFVSSFKHGVITDIGMTAAETIFLTIAVAFLLASVLRVRKITLKPFIIAASLFLLCGIVRNASESRKENTIVYNIRGIKLKAWQDGRVLHVTPLEGSIPPEVKKHAATRGLKIKIIGPG